MNTTPQTTGGDSVRALERARAARSLERTRANAAARLVRERCDAGHWVGELSSSALSTATAVAALAVALRERPELEARLRPLVDRGLAWLRANAGADGGYGDTTDSPSNLSTTALVWMAFVATGPAPGEPAGSDAARSAEAWLRAKLGGLDADRLVAGLAEAYGKDKTFAVPILTACAVAGCFDDLWAKIPGLPFELAALPRGLFRHLGLPVVSYALPALIGIGQALHSNAPSRNPLARFARGATRRRTLRVLDAIQPTNGGFLEATPLTSFVVLSLCACGEERHSVVERGLEFLCASMRSDGSWPIDTNLATWTTTLSTLALAGDDEPEGLEAHLDAEERERVVSWLLGQQLREVHPYTGAAPGGWAWTDLPGGVPDADDTPGALLALHALTCCGTDAVREHLTADERVRARERVRSAATRGVRWLLDLQNRDGGMPTFCRGWGTLPFDESCADLTAHALRAFAAWSDELPAALANRAERASRRARANLVRTQRSDGAWTPLWFGSQDEERLENPLYGTTRVLRAVGVPTPDGDAPWRAALARGLDWLLAAQHSGGGFGAAAGVAPSIEETALALEALAAARLADLAPASTLQRPIERGLRWLVEATAEGTEFPARPIGLYFARLWYSERLYPLAFTVSALERCSAFFGAEGRIVAVRGDRTTESHEPSTVLGEVSA